MKGIMKKIVCAAAACLLLAGCAQADGGEWHSSSRFGAVRFTEHTGGYYGYVNTDGEGGITSADPYFLMVISKSASIWSEPRTNSKKIASASYGEQITCRSNDGGLTVWEQDGFYAVEYKGKYGWINQDYVIRNTLEIVLMESNVPAYIAPDRNAKKVGSLAKHTRYRVIGFCDDFYIVSFRGAAAAFIPMDVRHYDTAFEGVYRQAPTYEGQTVRKTTIRTGPGGSYPELKTVNTGYTFEAIDCVDGWYLIHWYESGTDGGAYAFISADDAQANGL